MKKILLTFLCCFCFSGAFSQYFLGQIVPVGFTFCPRNFVPCDGQLLQINTHTALFSLLGTTYGGDGRTTFGIPDLESRTPIHTGHGAGLSNYRLGQKGGEENVTLTIPQIPSHSHTTTASGSLATKSIPSATDLPAHTNEDSYASGNVVNMQETSLTGDDRSHNNMPPFLTIRYCICIAGIFPTRP